MRVAFVLATSGGGTGRHVRTLAAGCAAGGVAVRVLGPAQTNRDFQFGASGVGSASGASGGSVRFVPVEIADRPHPAGDLRAIARLRRLLPGADVVHAHGMRAGALTALALAAVRRRPPLVVTVHNAPVAGGATGAVYRTLELIVARRAESVLCVSADLADRMRAAGARRVGATVVSAPGSPAAASGPPADPPLVLAVGRLATQKGFGVLIDAAARLRDLRPEPRLMIVGQGPLDAELKAKSAALGVAAEFAGHRDDVPALLAAATVFVLPSQWEGQALILQEALRAGAAIVATRVGGNPAVAGEDAALFVPPGDPAALADAVRAVLTDRDLAARLRKAALARAATLPDEEAAVAAVLTEYAHLGHGGLSPPHRARPG
ncbi:MAG TPA: glycosyltransferase family 4 protein [Streptosporangiaceae bacterium]|nr:glycosyltransferase family 4 protein [Streptosporangiaceae bacterium]